MTSSFETRLFVSADLKSESIISLGADKTHRLRNVLRLKSEAQVALFNGRDGEWLGELSTLTKKSATLKVLKRLRPLTMEADIWLIFAPIKRARIDFVAQKATELGASVLWPVFTQYTVMERVNIERMRANSIEAAEQSGRLTVPKILEPVHFSKLIEQWPAERRLFCCDETGKGIPLVKGFLEHNAGTAAILVGPEGGFTDEELDRISNLPNVCRVSLGGRILRSDTAAFAALACWQAISGDWALL